MNKRMLSLFSGCGGMDMGFLGGFKVFKCLINEKIHPEWTKNPYSRDFYILPKTSFETVFANDILDSAEIIWQKFFQSKYTDSDDIFYKESIVELVRLSKQKKFRFPKNIDILTGGFPCQDFSISGKRKGLTSKKNHLNLDVNFANKKESRGFLYYWMREVIKITKPKMFVAENVKGLVSLKEIKQKIEYDLSDAGTGYLVLPGKVFHVANFGIPQSRERVIFFGFLKSALRQDALDALSSNGKKEYSPFPKVTHYFGDKFSLFDDSHLRLKQVPPLKSILINLPEPNESDDPSQKNFSKAKWYGTKVQGQIEIDLNRIAPTIRSEHHGNIEFRRLSKRNGGKIISELNQNLSERRLTVRECLRIQTFPDDFQLVFPGENNRNYLVSPTAGYKLVGNAVPPLFAYHLASRLESIWQLLFKK